MISKTAYFVFVENSGFLVLLENRPIGVEPDGNHGGVLLLQVLAGAADGAAGAHTAGVVRDLAVGAIPAVRPRARPQLRCR